MQRGMILQCLESERYQFTHMQASEGFLTHCASVYSSMVTGINNCSPHSLLWYNTYEVLSTVPGIQQVLLEVYIHIFKMYTFLSISHHRYCNVSTLGGISETTSQFCITLIKATHDGWV